MCVLQGSLLLQEKPDMLLASKALAPLLTSKAKFIQQHFDPFLSNLLHGWKPTRVNNRQQFSFAVGPLYRQPWAGTSHRAARDIFFQKTKPSLCPQDSGTCRELSKWNHRTGFPRQPFPFYFQDFSIPKETCNRVIIHSSRKRIYVCVYVHTYIYIHTHALSIHSHVIQHSQLFHNPQPSKQSGQANLITNLLQMW